MNSKIKILFLVFFFFTLTKNSSAQLIPDFKVNTDLTNYHQFESKIGADKEGNFVIIWDDQRVFNTSYLYLQRFNKNGVPLGVNKKVYNSDSLNGNNSIAMTEIGDFFITGSGYHDNNNTVCWITHFNKFGDSLSSYRLNDDTISNLTNVSVSTSASGIIIACWESQSGIIFQRLDSLGHKIGNNVIVTNTFFEENPAITVKKDGRFISTWQETNNIYFTSEIYCQLFDMQGNKIGSKIRVSQTISSELYYSHPNIAADSSGRFCIAFDRYTLSCCTEPFFQLFDKNGNKKGSNVVYSSTGFPIITAEPSGEMLIYTVLSGKSTLFKIDTLGNRIGNSFFISDQVPDSGKIYPDFVIMNKKIYSSWADNRNGNFDIYANVRSYIKPDSIVGIHNVSNEIPSSFKLYQNYPNPFNPTTRINYELPSSGFVSLKIYNSLGAKVASLVDQRQSAGFYSVDFNSTEFNLASGIYYYKLEAGSFTETKKLILIK